MRNDVNVCWPSIHQVIDDITTLPKLAFLETRTYFFFFFQNCKKNAGVRIRTVCRVAAVANWRQKEPGVAPTAARAAKRGSGPVPPATLCLLGAPLAYRSHPDPAVACHRKSRSPVTAPQTSRVRPPPKQSASFKRFARVPAHRCFSLSTRQGALIGTTAVAPSYGIVRGRACAVVNSV